MIWARAVGYILLELICLLIVGALFTGAVALTYWLLTEHTFALIIGVVLLCLVIEVHEKKKNLDRQKQHNRYPEEPL